MRSVAIEIQGQSALLMHSFPMVAIEALEKKPVAEQAELAAYRFDGKLYVPAMALTRAMVSGATYSKGKGRGTLQRVVAACVLISPERLILTPQEYIVDSRPVVVPATKGRVLRHRPRFDKWELAATIEFDETLMTPAQVRRVLDDTGSRVGLLDFRPERKGPFGRFIVTKWKEA
jgi:hypothetical protein